MLFQVTSPHGNDHFLNQHDAVAHAIKWSELLTGKFVVWCDGLVECAYRDGLEVVS
jgi:hypothetical protein